MLHLLKSKFQNWDVVVVISTVLSLISLHCGVEPQGAKLSLSRQLLCA